MDDRSAYEAAKARVIEDYRAVAGKIVLCPFVQASVDPDAPRSAIPAPRECDDVYPDGGVWCRVDEGMSVDHAGSPLFHDTGSHLDPYWDVTPVEHVPELEGTCSHWTYGWSYNLATGEREHCNTDPVLAEIEED